MYILLCRVYMICPKSDIAPEYAKHSVRYIKKIAASLQLSRALCWSKEK